MRCPFAPRRQDRTCCIPRASGRIRTDYVRFTKAAPRHSGSLATSRRPASNRYPPPYRGGALPLELRRHVPALPLSYAPSGGATQCPLPGFPLRVPPLHGYRVAAHHLAGRRESNPRLGRATGGSRTPNAQFRRLALCPLSYCGKAVRASFDLAASAVTGLRSTIELTDQVACQCCILVHCVRWSPSPAATLLSRLSSGER